MRTDGLTDMMKLIVAFHDFANALKNFNVVIRGAEQEATLET